MPALRRTRMLVWKNRRVVKIGRPTKRVSPRATAMMKDEQDISDTANSEKCNCRQNSSDGCSTVGMRSMPSGFTVPSMIGQVRGLLVMPMLSCRFMKVFSLVGRGRGGRGNPIRNIRQAAGSINRLAAVQSSQHDWEWGCNEEGRNGHPRGG